MINLDYINREADVDELIVTLRSISIGINRLIIDEGKSSEYTDALLDTRDYLRNAMDSVNDVDRNSK